MPTKKGVPSGKGGRVSALRAADYTRAFHRDWQRLARSGRYDMARLKHVMLLLIANDEPLGPEWKDHALKGDWVGHRECHIGGDFLLAYKLSEMGTSEGGKSGSVVFVRAGTHADLFRE